MKFSLPSQLRGPECRVVITRAIALRKELEPVFLKIDCEEVNEFAIVLRVDGSLGSFGNEGIGSIKLLSGVLECDAVVKDYGWKDLGKPEISGILKNTVLKSIQQCFTYAGINPDISEIITVLESR